MTGKKMERVTMELVVDSVRVEGATRITVTLVGTMSSLNTESLAIIAHMTGRKSVRVEFFAYPEP